VPRTFYWHTYLQLTRVLLWTGLPAALAVTLIPAVPLIGMLAKDQITALHFARGLIAYTPVLLYLFLPVLVGLITGLYYWHKVLDSEVVVLRGSGIPTWSIALPGVLFAFACMLIGYVGSLYLVPVAFREFQDIRRDALERFTYRALEPSKFNEIVPGLTVYFAHWRTERIMENVLVVDTRDADLPMTLQARLGEFVSRGAEMSVLFSDGRTQVLEVKRDSYRTSEFKVLVQPVSGWYGPGYLKREKPGWFEQHVWDLLDPPPAIKRSWILPFWLAEGHRRVVAPFLCLTYTLPILAFFLSLRGRRQANHLLAVGGAVAIVFFHVSFFFSFKILANFAPGLLALLYGFAIVPVVAGAAWLVAADRNGRRSRAAIAEARR